MSGIDSAPTDTMSRCGATPRGDDPLERLGPILDRELGAFAGGAEKRDAIAAGAKQHGDVPGKQSASG